MTDKIEIFLMGFLVGFSMWNACSRVVGLYLGEHYKKLSSYTYSGSPSKNLSVYDFNPEIELTLLTYKSYVGERTMQIYHSAKVGKIFSYTRQVSSDIGQLPRTHMLVV